MHEIACLATYNFKYFRETIRTDPLRLAPFGRIVSPFNLYAVCYFLFDAYKNFFQEQWSDIGETIIKILHHGSFIYLYLNIVVDSFFTVTSTKYQRQKMEIWKWRHWGEITKFINSYERDSSIKWNLKGFSAKCYCL